MPSAGRRPAPNAAPSTTSPPAAPASSASPRRSPALFPGQARHRAVERLPGRRRAPAAELEAVAAGGCDIVIGTQLVAKGHNFPHLTLVGVLDADIGLTSGDPRAAERTFQLLQQVTGRAGRGEKPGRALVQTYQPDHPVIAALLSGDAERFYAEEIAGPRGGRPAAVRAARRADRLGQRARDGRGARAGAGPRRRAAGRRDGAGAGRGAARADPRPLPLPAAGEDRAQRRPADLPARTGSPAARRCAATSGSPSTSTRRAFYKRRAADGPADVRRPRSIPGRARDACGSRRSDQC